VNDGYLWWLILVGAVVTLAVIWVFATRLPRAEQDVGEDERRAEAAWIGETIERFGGIAPVDLVEEVLELHAEYLASPRLARVPDRRAVAGTSLDGAGDGSIAPMPPPAPAVPGLELDGLPLSVPADRPERVPPPRPR
jgi:hypothetical protein